MQGESGHDIKITAENTPLPIAGSGSGVLDGPYQPTSFNPPGDYWILLNPTDQQVVLEGTNKTDLWIALLLVEPNVINQSRQYTLFGETKQITIENNTNKWKFFEVFRRTVGAEFQHKHTLISDTKLAGFLKLYNSVWTFYGETPHATTDYLLTSNLSEVETVIHVEFYIIPRSQESKCVEYINTGLPPMQNTRNIVPVMLSSRSVTHQRAQVNELEHHHHHH